MQIINVSPQGDLDCPLLGTVVESGEFVDCTAEQARVLLDQPANWQPHDDEAKALLDELAEAETEKAEADLVDGGMPQPSALRSAWIVWAASRGDADADSKTKAQLIDEHGFTAVLREREAAAELAAATGVAQDTAEQQKAAERAAQRAAAAAEKAAAKKAADDGSGDAGADNDNTPGGN
jgi:hypothetical protein